MGDVESYIAIGVYWLKLTAELISIMIIASGILVSTFKLLRQLRMPDIRIYNDVRLGFSRYLVLALEFQLAADLVGTSLTPTWDQLGRLAVIATIRTFLNFFLQYELKQEKSPVAENPPTITGETADSGKLS